MAASSSRLSVSLLWLSLLLILSQKSSSTKYTRGDFPSDFVFGAGTSAYQYEGAVAEDGRKPSIWDTFTHEGRAPDKSNGDVAADGYHKYKEDVKLMRDMGLQAYKFSISWSRLLPDGRGAINPKALKYYNNVINEIVKQGIKLHVTLYHGDHPQSLQDEYGGWLNNRMLDDFKEYANVCFKEFGDRVSRWTTFAEPNIMTMAAYDTGLFAPGRCCYPFGLNCMAGNSTTEPYIVVHNILLAHAQVVKLYKNIYQAIQRGWIGINVYTAWYYPLSNSSADIEATQRVKDFMIGWILEPVVFGDYPEIMKKNAGSRLPSFTQQQCELLKGSFDFISLNHYTSSYVADNSKSSYINLRDLNKDMFAEIRGFQNETISWPDVPTHLLNDPLGLQYMLEYIKDKFANPPVYIEENGYGLGAIKKLNDTDRIEFLGDYIGRILQAMRNGANVKGYFVWSLVDLFEYLAGYKSSFGLYYVDFDDDERKRVPKLSAHWYSNFLKNIEGGVIGGKYLASQ